MDMSIQHCVTTIARIVDEDRADPRSLLQLGYNLGRLSELTGLGREPFWDRWKDPVTQWNQAALMVLVQDLQLLAATTPQTLEPLEPSNAPPGESIASDS